MLNWFQVEDKDSRIWFLRAFLETLEFWEVLQVKNLIRKAKRKKKSNQICGNSAVSVPTVQECASVPAAPHDGEDYPGEYDQNYHYVVSIAIEK